MNIKNVILPWLRFERQFKLVATEAGFLNSDVLAIDKKDRIYEFEVKVSYSDFLADFRKPKHNLFAGESPEHFKTRYGVVDGKYQMLPDKVLAQRYVDSIPYKFYFFVCDSIKDKCLEYLSKNKLPYGLYSFKQSGEFTLERDSKVIKKTVASNLIKKSIISRMGSEIANLRKANNSLLGIISRLENEVANLEALQGEVLK